MSASDKLKLDNIDENANYIIVDTSLNSNSTNPVQNKVINTKFNAVQSSIDNKVPSSRTINGKTLTADITLSASDVGALPSSTVIPSIDGLATETYVNNKVTGLATETYVNNKVAGLVDSAPSTLDTLNELAAALGDDPNFATTIATQIGGKVDKVNGKGLSTNDYTTAEKQKLANIANGANNYTLPVATSSTLGGIKSGTDITIDASGNVSVNDDSHNHIIGNVDGLQSALNGKVDKVEGKQLSTNDFTNAYKTKLDGLPNSIMAGNIKTALGYAPGKMTYNLLDNSDFRNPVNQRGNTSYSNATQYTIDRWAASPCALTVNNNSISITKGPSSDFALFVQYVPDCIIGKSYTFAAKNTTGEIVVLNFVYSTDMGIINKPFKNTSHRANIRYSSNRACLAVGVDVLDQTSLDLEYAALYEGEYTTETLPEYQPKGYGSELAECQRYFQRFDVSVVNKALGLAVARSATTAAVIFNLMTPMRTYPAMTCTATFKLLGNVTKTALTPVVENAYFNMVRLNFTTSNLTANAVYFAAADAVGYMDFSADL